MIVDAEVSCAARTSQTLNTVLAADTTQVTMGSGAERRAGTLYIYTLVYHLMTDLRKALSTLVFENTSVFIVGCSRGVANDWPLYVGEAFEFNI